MAYRTQSAPILRNTAAALMACVISLAALFPSAVIAQTAPVAPDTGAPAAEQPTDDALNGSQTVTRMLLPLIAFHPCGVMARRTDHPFGVQVYGDVGPKNPYYCDLVESDSAWARNEVAWASVEPRDMSPPEYRWAAVDQEVEAAIGGFHLIMTILGNPSWAATNPEGVIDKAPLSRFASFVGALVERYDGDGIDDAPGSPKVDHWEFYNEPDAAFIRNANRWGRHGAEYAEMLAAVYPAVKAANPNAKVLLGGIAYDWFEDQNGPFVRSFLDDVLSNDGGQYFDIMNFHQYPAFAPNWGSAHGPGLLEKTAAIRAKLAEYDLEKPLFITESGMHSNDAVGLPMTPEWQARYVSMLFAQTLAADVDVFIWWMLHDVTPAYPYRNGLVTLVTADQPRAERKPSFDAYRTAIALLAPVSFEQTLTVAETGNPDMSAYRFADGDGRPFFVAWLGPVTRTDAAPLQLAGAVATVFDIYGASRTVVDGEDGSVDGKITLWVRAQPAYVRIES